MIAFSPYFILRNERDTPLITLLLGSSASVALSGSTTVYEAAVYCFVEL